MRRNWSLERTVITAGLCVFAVGALVFWFSYGDGSEGPGMQVERDLRDALGLILQQYGAASSDKQMIEEAVQNMLPFLVQIASRRGALLDAYGLLAEPPGCQALLSASPGAPAGMEGMVAVESS